MFCKIRPLGKKERMGRKVRYRSVEQANKREAKGGTSMSEWISVKDRLPEMGVSVLGMTKKNPFCGYAPAVVVRLKNGWSQDALHEYVTNVTHWMPLPAPPEET